MLALNDIIYETSSSKANYIYICEYLYMYTYKTLNTICHYFFLLLLLIYRIIHCRVLSC